MGSPFVKDLYYVPFANHDFQWAYDYIEALDPESGQVLHASPYLLVNAERGIDAYLPDISDPVIAITGDEFHLGQGPPHWFGSFANSDWQISLEPALTRRAGLFLNQSCDRGPYSALPYELKQDGALVTSGMLPGSSGDWDDRVDPVNISLASSGIYSLSVTYDQYWVGSQPGQARVVADFDTTRADKDPPILLSLKVLCKGETTDILLPSVASEVRFRVQDPGGLSQVLLFYQDDGDWVSMPLTSVGDEYTAQLPGFTSGAYVSLKIVAQDTAGNSLTYEVVPAFEVAFLTFLPYTCRAK